MARQRNPPIAAADRLFLDTSYVIARFNRRDTYHETAKLFANVVAGARELWTTNAVLLEVAAAFSNPPFRSIAIEIWDEFHGGNSRCHSLEAAGDRLVSAMKLFRARSDKSWSLTDCLSFVAMAELNLQDALTTDGHFTQAGFRAILLKP